MSQVIYTSTIPQCFPCGTKKIKRQATRRAETLLGETWDMCDVCAATLAETPGVVYKPWNERPITPRVIQPTSARAKHWDYYTEGGRVHVVAMPSGRFEDVRSATTYAVASARWFKIPVYIDNIEIWTPKGASHEEANDSSRSSI